MAKFFKFPFALSGTKTAVPDATQGDGSVSYNEGYSFDYERDPMDADVKYPERDKFNQVLYDMTSNLLDWQRHGFPYFITTSDNGGTPYSYDIHAYVRWDDGSGDDIYESIVNSNTSLPSDATKWRRITQSNSSFPTGIKLDHTLSTLPAGGWIWADGKTIGNASSGATNRANADTSALFMGYWSSYPNSVLPIQDSSGAASTRGISAAADFAANKRLPVPDMRGTVEAGKDDMGGTAAGRLTAAGSGIDGTILGASGGVETVSLTSNQNAAHSHDGSALTTSSAGAHTHTVTTANPGTEPSQVNLAKANSNASPGTFTTSSAGAHTHTITGTTGSSGTGAAHQNTQPTWVCNKIIKL